MKKVKSAKQLTFTYFSIVAFAIIAIHFSVFDSTLEGVELKRFKGRHGGKHGFAARLGVACPCCHLRSRSVALLTAELGPKAPLCFLGAWLEQFGKLDPVVHKDWTPSLDDMKSYKARKLAD